MRNINITYSRQHESDSDAWGLATMWIFYSTYVPHGLEPRSWMSQSTTFPTESIDRIGHSDIHSADGKPEERTGELHSRAVVQVHD